MRNLCFFFLLSILVSCSNNDEMAGQLNRIKDIGNTDPDSAMTMLKNIETEIGNSNEYMRNKAKLLAIRLNDKACNVAVSDVEIRQVINYFQETGHPEDMQEVYYYAGSVYRDLDDVPSALMYFMKSTESAVLGTSIDSVMLRNSYSQLYALYFSVQDYSNALAMAKREKTIAKELKILDANTVLHEGAALLRLDSLSAAKKSIIEAFEYLDGENDSVDIYALSSLLYQLSSIGCLEESHKCYEHLRAIEEGKALPPSAYLAMGKYFLENEKIDSAISCYDSVLQITSELDYRYDASRQLSLVYDSRNDIAKANLYAQIFISVSDSLNLGRRQIEAATTHNRYKYQKNKEEEMRIRAEKEHYRMMLTVAVALSLIAIVLLFAYFTYRRNLHLKKMIETNSRLNILSEKHQQLEKNIAADKKLRAESAVDVAEVIARINEIADNPKEYLREDYWDTIFNTVDKLYPDFRDQIISRNSNLENKDIVFIYLMKLGYKQADISRITNKVRSVVSRKFHRIEGLLGVPMSDLLG